MLQSQFDILEAPEQALTIEVTQEPDVMLRQVKPALGV
jgi:gluconate kinase